MIAPAGWNDAPVVVKHDGVFVVRDDLHPAGTKGRYLWHLFNSADEVVYASPAEGGAQTALAATAIPNSTARLQTTFKPMKVSCAGCGSFRRSRAVM
jgi:hypothetical protein